MPPPASNSWGPAAPCDVLACPRPGSTPKKRTCSGCFPGGGEEEEEEGGGAGGGWRCRSSQRPWVVSWVGFREEPLLLGPSATYRPAFPTIPTYQRNAGWRERHPEPCVRACAFSWGAVIRVQLECLRANTSRPGVAVCCASTNIRLESSDGWVYPARSPGSSFGFGGGVVVVEVT